MAIQQQIPDLQSADQQNSCRQHQSNSESDQKRQSQHLNFQGKALIEYLGEDHPKLDPLFFNKKKTLILTDALWIEPRYHLQDRIREVHIW